MKEYEIYFVNHCVPVQVTRKGTRAQEKGHDVKTRAPIVRKGLHRLLLTTSDIIYDVIAVVATVYKL